MDKTGFLKDLFIRMYLDPFLCGRFIKVLLYMLLYILWESDLPGHSIIYMLSASGRYVMEMAVLDRRDLLKRDTFSLDIGYPFLVDQRMYSRYLKTARIRLNTCGYAICASGSIFLQDFLELL